MEHGLSYGLGKSVVSSTGPCSEVGLGKHAHDMASTYLLGVARDHLLRWSAQITKQLSKCGYFKCQ